ncbi:hypothetical protein LPICM02_350003 [Pseudolactococcus piscium]|nr:hypothetical protein LPICM02_350003 [Lactococcus piscium]
MTSNTFDMWEPRYFYYFLFITYSFYIKMAKKALFTLVNFITK